MVAKDGLLWRWMCGALTVVFFGSAAWCDEWPQWRGPHRDGVWREDGVMTQFDGEQLPIRWRREIAGGYAGPTVAAGRLYVTDRLDEPKEIERVHCFDAMTGKPIWSHSYDCKYQGFDYTTGPRASVTVDGPRAYSLGAMGHLHCFDAATGNVHWSKDLNRTHDIQMPIWGIAASPLIDGDRVIVLIGGKGDACLVAFDKISGKEQWRALGDMASYSAPVLVAQGGKRVLLCRTTQRVVGVDPASGELYWELPFESNIGIATPVVHKDYVFMSDFYNGSLMLKLATDEPAVSEVWRIEGRNEIDTKALHSLISTPYLEGDYIYGVDSYGQLRCLELLTGERVWESLDAVPKARWANIHLIKHDEQVWMFNERGELIISNLSPEGFHEISRTQLIKPTRGQLNQRGGVCWTHPALAYKHIYVRNDEELVCASLAASPW